MKEMLLDYIRSNLVELQGLFGGYSQHFGNALEVTSFKRTLIGYEVTFEVPDSFYDNGCDDHLTEISIDDILVWLWGKQ